MRPKTHKFAIQTKGLTDEQAARLMLALAGVTEAMVDNCQYESATNTPVKILRQMWPDRDFKFATAAQRRALVT